MGSLKHNSKCFIAINSKLGTDTSIGSGKMPIHFVVSGVSFAVKGVNFGVNACIEVKIALMGTSCPAL